MYLQIGRFNQVRHLLAVVSEIMKVVNQDTEIFRKLKDMFCMVKTMYWAMILSLSELKEVILKSPALTPSLPLATLKECVIDFGIPLPNGEDSSLPTELIATEAQRVPIYEKLRTYKQQLQRSTLPHIAKIYSSVLMCDINYYDANNGHPFCCGKHSCAHPH